MGLIVNKYMKNTQFKNLILLSEDCHKLIHSKFDTENINKYRNKMNP